LPVVNRASAVRELPLETEEPLFTGRLFFRMGELLFGMSELFFGMGELLFRIGELPLRMGELVGAIDVSGGDATEGDTLKTY
jgi:hypothetical protein